MVQESLQAVILGRLFPILIVTKASLAFRKFVRTYNPSLSGEAGVAAFLCILNYSLAIS